MSHLSRRLAEFLCLTFMYSFCTAWWRVYFRLFLMATVDPADLAEYDPFHPSSTLYLSSHDDDYSGLHYLHHHSPLTKGHSTDDDNAGASRHCKCLFWMNATNSVVAALACRSDAASSRFTAPSCLLIRCDIFAEVIERVCSICTDRNYHRLQLLPKDDALTHSLHTLKL